MAALNKKPDETFKELEIPEGGISGYAMSEEDFDTLETKEAEKEFGKDGLAQFTAVAKRMAGHGRFGDDSVAHIQTGEIVVPLSLIENNPALKEQIFKRLRDSGIEDPEQYVVGSKANSINPETGLMEFGFFSRIWRSFKKVVKKVIKVFKKVAPVILPIALSMTGLGPVFGAALGSGLGTLINGGSIGDALKSGLISGATGAAFAGFSGPAPLTGEGFMQNVRAATANPSARLSAAWEGAKSTLTGGGLSGAGNLFEAYTPTLPSSSASSGAQGLNAAQGGNPSLGTVLNPDDLNAIYNPALNSGTALGGALPAQTLPMSPGDMSQFPATSLAGLAGEGGAPPIPLTSQTTQFPGAGLEGGAPPIPLTSQTTQFPGAGLEGGAPPLAQQPLGTQVNKAPVYGRVLPSSAGSGLPPVYEPGLPSSAGSGAGGLNARALNTGNEMGLVDKAFSHLTGRAGYSAADYAALEEKPGLLARFGPAAAAGIGLTYASGGFDVPEQEEPGVVSRDAEGNVITGTDLINDDPGAYLIGDLGSQRLNPLTGRYEDVETGTSSEANPMLPRYNLNPLPAQRFFQPRTYVTPMQAPLGSGYLRSSIPRGAFSYNGSPVLRAAEGGPVFPRRNGGVDPSEGVSGQDSVRAMLMPGEFVMTTDAVRGLGGGNLNSGIKSMYSVMKHLESRGRAAA
jgi:hypothetical protein